MDISRRLGYWLLGLFWLVLPGYAAASGGEVLECAEQPAMGTPFKICVVVNQEQVLNVAFDLKAAFYEIDQINKWMSDWLPDSELSRANRAAGGLPVAVSRDLLSAVRETLEVSKASDGALDPTFNVFFGLYRFKAGEEREPSEAEIAERLPLIDWKSVVVDETKGTLFLKKPGMKLGLGAVGQSYAADRVAAMLKVRGYRGGYVDGSGDTVFWGAKPDGALWTTAIRDPRDKSKVILRIYGTDFAITTCGDDEKFFMKDGRRVHHVLDPKTGRPAILSRQVTVIAKRGFDADAWDTAAFVMGPKRAKDILEKRGLKAVMVGSDGVVTLTKGLTKQQTPWGEGYTVDEFTADRREVLAPLGKAPVSKAPVSKAPVSKAPAVKRPEDTK